MRDARVDPMLRWLRANKLEECRSADDFMRGRKNVAKARVHAKRHTVTYSGNTALGGKAFSAIDDAIAFDIWMGSVGSNRKDESITKIALPLLAAKIPVRSPDFP
jgi:hypothetical protein